MINYFDNLFFSIDWAIAFEGKSSNKISILQ